MRYTQAYAEHGSHRKAAEALGISRSTFADGYARERRLGIAATDPKHMRSDGLENITLPTFRSKHPPVQTIINRLASDMRRKSKRVEAEKWFPVHVNDTKPIGILWFGDPHLGVLCDWDQLQRDVAYCASTPGLYGANIGDVADNWVGSLMRIAAEQDISRATERRLAKWFLTEAGITWLVWIFGNHDEWNDGADIMRLMDIHQRVPMFDWSAKFELRFPNKKKIRVHASHDFPGHSMWNNTHGPARAPRMLGNGADLYICGHKHTWGIQQYEMPDADLSPLAVRLRGYKRHDPHARRLGYPDDKHGCSVLTIFDPGREGPGRVTAFADVDQGVRVLRALRGDVASKRPRSKPNGRKQKKRGRK
jgi:hypothetical protein